MWRVYSLSHCCGVRFLVCREKTGFFEHSKSPINYCTIVHVSQKRCRYEVCDHACVRVWLLHWLFDMCLSRDGTQRDMQFLLVDKVGWIPIMIVKKRKTTAMRPDSFKIQGAFFVPHLRCTAEGFQ